MKWTKFSTALILCAGSTGCATSALRETNGSVANRPFARPRTTAPRQVQVDLPPEQPDLFAAAPARPDRYRLSRYFPGLGKPTAGGAAVASVAATAAMPAAVQGGSAAVVAPTGPTLATNSYRPSWFGFRKPRAPQTYMTDNRSATFNGAQPSLLPVALQLPRASIADNAVTPTAVELPSPAPKVPSNPDSSAAEASPLSTTEPQLAIPPLGAPAADSKPDIDANAGAGAEAAPKADAAAPKADTDPQPPAQPAAEPAPAPPESAAAVPTADPRERPRLAATSHRSFEVDPSAADDPQPRPAEAARPPADPKAPAGPAGTDAGAVKAAPTAADPMNSLGLPTATLPASYTQHSSVAVRGTGQVQAQAQPQQPPPVLASPQATPQASPQSAGPTGATKKWRRPCLRRLIRRMWNLGEFANPPTALPH